MPIYMSPSNNYDDAINLEMQSTKTFENFGSIFAAEGRTEGDGKNRVV